MRYDKQKIWGECKDCGYKATDGKDFSEHIESCKKNPVKYEQS